ncbi:MAG: S1C family serine protease [Planctomycetota bacterium]
MKNRSFCQRNLKAFFALLILLIVATITWAIAFKENINRGRHNADITPSNRSPKPTAGNLTVDAITMATPNKEINLIGRPGTFPPSIRLGVPDAPARMQLAATGAGSRHAFNTVSSLILPSVVNIHAARNQAGNGTLGAGGGARFTNPFDGVPEKFVQNKAFESVGSGFVIDSRGYILTNYHVISQATDLLVSISGKLNKDFPATVIATHPAADLALIKVSGTPTLPEAKLGDSRTAQVGDWVLAFGSPFGLEQTVTQGIISNKWQSLVVGGVSYGGMLQTDAPINRGSSGGPLVNLKAEVIGINTAIYGPDGAFSGTGFAISANRAKAFLASFSRVLEH